MVERKYTVGNDRALFLFSKGYCYFPQCPVKVFRQVGNDMFTQVQRAHIIAVEENGPRWRNLPEHVLNSHANLMLMCQAHHQAIDRDEGKYPIEMLRKWKEDHEAGQVDALRGLEGFGEEDFRRVMAETGAAVKQELFGAIDRISEENQGIASALRNLVTSSVRQPGIDPDSAQMVSDAARILMHLNLYESSSTLIQAAMSLKDMRSTIDGFIGVSSSHNGFSEVSGHIRELDATVAELKDVEIQPNLTPLHEAISRIEEANASLAHNALSDLVDRGRWKLYAGAGFVCGIVATGLLWWLVATGGA